MLKKVGVIRGGVSYDRQKSLEYGKHILDFFKNHNSIKVFDLVLHPNGAWTQDGYLKDLESIMQEIDIIFNSLVGHEAEAGHISEIVELQNKKNIGHSSLHNRLVHDKKNLHDIVKQHNIKTPYNKIVKRKDFDFQSLLENFKFVGVPSIVKPNSGSDMHLVDLVFHYEDLLSHGEKIVQGGNDVLIEQHIKGISVSVFVYEYHNSLQTIVYTHNKKDFDNLKKEDFINLRNIALKIHQSLGFDFHVEYDFVINKNGIYFIEANTNPSLKHDFLDEIWKDDLEFQKYLLYLLQKNI